MSKTFLVPKNLLPRLTSVSTFLLRIFFACQMRFLQVPRSQTASGQSESPFAQDPRLERRPIRDSRPGIRAQRLQNIQETLFPRTRRRFRGRGSL